MLSFLKTSFPTVKRYPGHTFPYRPLCDLSSTPLIWAEQRPGGDFDRDSSPVRSITATSSMRTPLPTHPRAAQGQVGAPFWKTPVSPELSCRLIMLKNFGYRAMRELSG